jgi:hypothetical protein
MLRFVRIAGRFTVVLGAANPLSGSQDQPDAYT